MSNSIAVGPALPLAGNLLQATNDGKIKVTNSKGKEFTLTQDQFMKQVAKNSEKIEAGEDVDFKKDYTKAIVAGSVALATTAAGLAGLGYAVKKGHLQKSEILKNDVFLKKAGKHIKNFAVTVGEKVNKYASDFSKWVKKFADKAEEKIDKAKKATKKKTSAPKKQAAPKAGANKAPKKPSAKKA